MAEISYREPKTSDAEATRDLRLAVLRTDSTAFFVTIEAEQEGPVSFLEHMLAKCHKADDCMVFGAFDRCLLGVVGTNRRYGKPVRHKARIWGLYVSLPYRRQGVGRSLLEPISQYLSHANTVLRPAPCLDARSTC